MTPEGRVKAKVQKILLSRGIFPASKAGVFPEDSKGWYYMPGQSVYATKGVPDFIGHYQGRFWGVETKAPGKKPTGFQALQIASIRQSGGAVFVIDGDTTEFETWLDGGIL